MTMAVLSSNAWMPRKSSLSPFGGVAQCSHVLPPLVVRRTSALRTTGPDDAATHIVDAAKVGCGIGFLNQPLRMGRRNEDGQDCEERQEPHYCHSSATSKDHCTTFTNSLVVNVALRLLPRRARIPLFIRQAGDPIKPGSGLMG